MPTSVVLHREPHRRGGSYIAPTFSSCSPQIDPTNQGRQIHRHRQSVVHCRTLLCLGVALPSLRFQFAPFLVAAHKLCRTRQFGGLTGRGWRAGRPGVKMPPKHDTRRNRVAVPADLDPSERLGLGLGFVIRQGYVRRRVGLG